MRISDLSSDVCSSDLEDQGGDGRPAQGVRRRRRGTRGGGGQRLADLRSGGEVRRLRLQQEPRGGLRAGGLSDCLAEGQLPRDRKSTRELQSLMRISYAVFCL